MRALSLCLTCPLTASGRSVSAIQAEAPELIPAQVNSSSTSTARSGGSFCAFRTYQGADSMHRSDPTALKRLLLIPRRMHFQHPRASRSTRPRRFSYQSRCAFARSYIEPLFTKDRTATRSRRGKLLRGLDAVQLIVQVRKIIQSYETTSVPLALPLPCSRFADLDPNCIARFGRDAAPRRPMLRASSRSSRLSPCPSPSRGSHLICSDVVARKSRTSSSRKGYLCSSYAMDQAVRDSEAHLTSLP